jgi:hypothetical protein
LGDATRADLNIIQQDKKPKSKKEFNFQYWQENGAELKNAREDYINKRTAALVKRSDMVLPNTQEIEQNENLIEILTLMVKFYLLKTVKYMKVIF